MSISGLTAIRIATDPEVYASAYGPVEGKYGLYVGTYDEAPSGWKRPRDLMTSDPIYDTPEAAKSAGEAVIRELKQENLDVST